uniref:DUF4187 domain-containing protein n=1 Tax=Parastrongyloides trichosuri TaxID=131310 RepID=A0A0N4Z4K1_PARTI
MSDEDDYMSEALINGLPERSEEKIIRNRERDRLIKIAKRSEEARNRQLNTLSLPKMQEKVRKEIEEKPIPKDNIGVKLLMKMGYNLDNEESNKVKLNKPIVVETKVDTLGLGFVENEKKKVKELFDERVQQTRKKVEQIEELVDDFRKRKRDDKLYALTMSDLRKCQRVCHEMDQRILMAKPLDDYFWPRSIMKIKDDGEIDDEAFRLEKLHENELTEKLDSILNYLRDQHYYCTYCGCTFENVEELSVQCPGITREEHD